MIETFLYLLLLVPGMPDSIARPLALRFELLDERELRYKLDADLIRHRAWNLMGAPLVADAGKLPPRMALTENLAFLRGNLEFVNDCIVGWPEHAEYYKAWRREILALLSFWSTALDSQIDFYYVTVRRERLKKIRDEVGLQDWLFNNWPPMIPWRFFRE